MRYLFEDEGSGETQVATASQFIDMIFLMQILPLPTFGTDCTTHTFTLWSLTGQAADAPVPPIRSGLGYEQHRGGGL